MLKESRFYVVYHQIKQGIHCPDGIASAWIMNKFFKNTYPEQKINWLGMSYADKVPVIPDKSRIYIVDFSFPAAVMEKWADHGCKVIIHDHHISAKEMIQSLSDRIFKQFDETECGATIVWRCYFPEENPPAFLRHVKERDMGTVWDLGQDKFWTCKTNIIHKAMSRLRYSRTIDEIFEIYDGLAALSEKQLSLILKPLGQPILKAERSKCLTACDRAKLVDFDGHNVIYVKIEESERSIISEIGKMLYQSYAPDADFALIAIPDGSYSLRSNKVGNNFDVSAIAVKYGGGGHRNSAGFKPSVEQVKLFTRTL